MQTHTDDTRRRTARGATTPGRQRATASAPCPDCGTALPRPTSWLSQVTRHRRATIAEQRCRDCDWQRVWRVPD